MTQTQQVQNCIKSINVTWLIITVWHFIVVVDKDMKSCPKTETELGFLPSSAQSSTWNTSSTSILKYFDIRSINSADDENELENQSIDIPIWKRYLLSVTEAAQFYHIGEKRLRQIVDIHPNGEFYLLVGNKVLFKKEQFEQFLAESTAI